MVRRWSWLLLAGLLAALLLAALRSDVRPVGEREVTFLMAAASLAWDGDLTYDRSDYDRYLQTWEREPEAVALESHAGSAEIGFARPPAYAVLAAPFVRVAPRRGPALLNWLLLTAAACASALVLQRRVGPWAASWIALFVGGTTAFILVPLPSPGLLRLAASALAWALVVQIMPVGGSRRPAETNGRAALRWFLVGCLLGAACLSSVDGLTLLPALAAAVWLALVQPRRQLAFLALAVGALSVAGALLGLSALARGGPGAVERAVFDRATGFPAVDFKAEEWSLAAERQGFTPGREAGLDPGRPGGRAHASAQTSGDGVVGGGVARGRALPGRPQVDFRGADGLRLRTALYALVGRTVGLLPYCAPVLWAALMGALAGGWRWALLVGAFGSFAARALLFPFDLGDESTVLGPGGVGALLPMFWFLAARLSPGRILATAVSAAVFLHPLWLPLWSQLRWQPWSQSDEAPRPGRLAAGALHSLLPDETTQRPGIMEPPDLFAGSVWLRPVAGRIAPFGEVGLVIENGWAEFLVAWEDGSPAGAAPDGRGTPSRLEVVLHGGDGDLEVVGGEVEGRRTLPSGRISVLLVLDAPVARHRLWWSRSPVALHRLRLSLGDVTEPRRFGRIELRPR